MYLYVHCSTIHNINKTWSTIHNRNKTWKQHKCPLTDEWIKKMWYIYVMEYYSTIKKNKIMPFAATWMELETLILSEVSQKEKDKYHLYLESNIWHK